MDASESFVEKGHQLVKTAVASGSSGGGGHASGGENNSVLRQVLLGVSVKQCPEVRAQLHEPKAQVCTDAEK